MKVLVTGANGQLGYDVIKRLNAIGDAPVGADREEFDITDEKATEEYITSLRPDAVVHCAAYTAVDKAEDDRDACRKVNVDGTRNIALACEKIGAKLVSISSDYVFGGSGDRCADLVGELLGEQRSARGAVRREQNVNASEVERLRRSDGCRDLGRMMGVSVHHGNALRLPHQVEAATNAREIGEHASCLLQVKSERPDEREHCRGVKHVVHAWVLLALAFDLCTVGKLEREGRTHAMRAVRHDARVAFLPQTIRDRARCTRRRGRPRERRP